MLYNNFILEKISKHITGMFYIELYLFKGFEQMLDNRSDNMRFQHSRHQTMDLKSEVVCCDFKRSNIDLPIQLKMALSF